MKKYKRVLILILSFFLMSNNVKATTLRDLYNELSTLQSSYNAAQKKANLTQAELNKVKASISSTEAEIKQAQADIIQAEKDIEQSEKDIETKKEETNQMLLYLQLTSSTGNSLLEYVFDADNYTDFIYRYSVVTQMTDYNQDLINELNEMVKTLNSKKETLATKQTELEKKKSELQANYLIVEAQYKDEKDDGADIATQISTKQKQINSYKNICSMDQDINTCSGISAVDGWVYPLASFYQSSSYAEARKSNGKTVYHYAVDLATYGKEGLPVRAVANGKVLARYSSTCGGLVIQIQHNYNGSNYVSLYMHLLTGSVNVGQNVTAGQVIGTSGGGPQEKAKWGDTCTEGAHLHFAMSTGGSMIESSSQQGSTFNPVRFFPAMKGEGSTYKGG